ncbi:hypothetical protein BCD91_004395 [Clostridium beijerinckii]|uniref:DUF262 domain-containing protein n=1 Tax=Clostridium beijerinckii TaxID=1520 RepID=UPI001494E40F|nr:DUF262 domain-containing protein [Clostridium beijerinckii]NOW92372.1 hypothetical protein [Clostridium beijerinckii]
MTKSDEIELLKRQINDLSYDIYVDAYPMSLSELISFYNDGDINLKAEYQRVFKWTKEQKTRFIESLLLGLPIPSIFLYQDENALWEVVDGIQRLSTIFEFVGVLKNSNDELFTKLELTSAPKLTHLEGLTYDDFPIDLQRTFKKLKLDLIIISKKSKKDIKLEVFRRLNGFGTKLNRQELRNALALLLDPNLFKFIDTMSNNKDFLKCFPFKGSEFEDKKHYEYFIRYLTLYETEKLVSFKSTSNTIDDLFDEVIELIASNKLFNNYEVQINFVKTFELLYSSLGDSVFKKYDAKTNKFTGKISESIFEVIVPGVSEHLDYYSKNIPVLINKIKDLHLENSVYKKATATNPKAIDRMKRLLSVSLEYFNPNE